MKIRNRFLRIVTGEVLLIVVTMVFFLTVNMIPTKMAVETTANPPEVFMKLSEIKIFKENFKAVGNNLNRVDILFKNPNLESRDELEIILRDKSDKVVGQQNFSGFNLGDTSHARMDFAPIADSKNENFELEIAPIKIIDRKLSFGTKEGKLDFIQYYGSNFSVRNSVNSAEEIVMRIIKYQPVVLFLPVTFLGMFLW